MRSLKPWLVGVVIAATPFAVAAEQTKPYPECTKEASTEDVGAAKGAFQAGQAAFNEADYARAITYWEDAYRRDCTAHPLLLNLARAYELSGQKRQAVVCLETFNQRNPGSGQKDQIERRIDVLKKQIEADDKAATAQTASATPTSTAAPTATTSAAPPEPPPTGKRPKLPLFVAIGGGGVALLSFVLIYNPGKSDVADFESQCPNRQCPNTSIEDQANSARTKTTIGGALSVAGLVVGVGGLIWYLASPKQPPMQTAVQRSRPRAEVVPAVAPGFTGLAFSGTF